MHSASRLVQRTFALTRARITATACTPIRIALRTLTVRSMSTDATSAGAAAAAAAPLDAPPAPAATAPHSSAMDTSSSASPAAPVAHAHYSCKLIGLEGWDNAVKVERRLLAAGVQFRGVHKKKGIRETTCDVYFDSDEQMKEQCARMMEMRAPAAQRSQQSAPNKVDDDTDAAVSADGAAAAASAAVPRITLGRQLFKVRDPRISMHPAPWTRPADEPVGTPSFRGAGGDRDDAAKVDKRGGKRQRTTVTVQEGEKGYVQPAEDESADAEVSRIGSEVAPEGSDGGRSASPSGRRSPPQEVALSVNDIVAPLWRKPYPEQLAHKRQEVVKLMRQTTRAWRREYKNTITLATECADPSQPDKPALFCPLEPIVGSAVTTAYRNKSEFSVGYNAEMKPAVGFLMGKFIEGTVTVESIAEVPHVPDIAKALVACLGSFVSASAEEGLLPYNKHGHSGFWRMLSVRNSAATRQCMCLVQVDPKERTAEQMDAFRAQLLQHFRTTIIDNEEWAAANGGYRLVALQLQLYSGVSNAAPEGTPIELLHGAEACIHESLMGLDFRVSQSAFFQINVAQTEVLYNIAARFAALPAVDAPQSVKNQHVLLDVCCGTGTIGQSLANRVGKVIGLEMSAAAVEDAKANAKANQITNAFYYTGKAEETLSLALAEHVATLPAADSSVSVTAIVDPPRSGLHADVIRLLRRCPRIQRVVYVSCNPRSLMDNLQRFLQPTSKTYQGPAFTAVKAVPVDMFPMCHDTEMVVLLEREKEKPKVLANKNKLVIKQFAHQMQTDATAAVTTTAGTAAPAAAATAATTAVSPAVPEAAAATDAAAVPASSDATPAAAQSL